MIIKIKKLKKSAKIPQYAHSGDAGFDVFSLEEKIIKPGRRKIFPLGFSTEIPKGFVGLVRDKSGLALGAGLVVLGGVIDSTYRGEWKVILLNTGQKYYQIKKGEKISQVLIVPVELVKFKIVKSLSNSDRSDGGFGSTGRK